jgi:hypothetical protein
VPLAAALGRDFLGVEGRGDGPVERPVRCMRRTWRAMAFSARSGTSSLSAFKLGLAGQLGSVQERVLKLKERASL